MFERESPGAPRIGEATLKLASAAPGGSPRPAAACEKTAVPSPHHGSLRFLVAIITKSEGSLSQEKKRP
jgi:hypothetical protein